MMSFLARVSASFYKHDRGWLYLLFALPALLYLPFLGSPFFFDDWNFFFLDASKLYAHSGFHFDLRWFPYASLGWTYAIFGEGAPHFYHLGNMLVHIANVILLFYLLRLLAGSINAGNKNPGIIAWGACFGALIFALHPVAVYAAGYVMQRSILMATFFALLMQFAYLRALFTGRARWLVLAAAAYFMAVFSKEHSVMTLLVLAAETVVFRAQIRANPRSLLLAWAVFSAIGFLISLRAEGVFGTPYEAMAAELFRQEGVIESTPKLQLLSALTQAGLFFKYLLLWILPNPAWMSMDMREPFVTSWLSWRGLLGAAGFLGYGALGVWLLLRPRWAALAGLALLYPWLQFVLEFSSIRVQEPFVLYRSYLWMPGFMLFIPLLLANLPGRKTFLALGLAVLLLVPLAANRLWVFADGYRLWNDAVLLLPDEHVAGADRIFYNRGQAEAAANKWDAAIADFQRAVAISPQLAPVRYQLGLAYYKAGRYQEAIEQIDAAIALKSDDAKNYFIKGLSLMALHQGEQAAVQMKKGCKLGMLAACLVSGDPKRAK